MLIRNWLKDVVCAEAEAVEETTSSGGDYSQVDPGDDRTLESPAPAEKSADETSESETLDEPGDEAQEPDAEQSADESEPAEKAAEDIGDDLLDRVATLGLDYSDIKQFRKASTLSAYLDQVEKLQTRLAARQQKPETPAPETEKKPDFKAKINSVKERIAKMHADGAPDDEIEVHRENLDLLETFAENQRLQEERITELLKHTTTQQEAAAKRQYEETVASFEKSINGLGDEYKTLFGKGSVKDLKPAELANRQKVWKTMDKLARLYDMDGEPTPEIDQLLNEAVALKFNKYNQQIARAKLKDDFKKAGSQTITRARPSGGEQQLTGEAAAIAKSAEFFAKNAS